MSSQLEWRVECLVATLLHKRLFLGGGHNFVCDLPDPVFEGLGFREAGSIKNFLVPHLLRGFLLVLSIGNSFSSAW